MSRYTALTNAQFLLAETTLTAQALEAGTTWAELRQAAQQSRLYGPGKANSQQTILNAIKSRMKGIGSDEIHLLAGGRLEDRQLLNLALVTRQKPILLDFLSEVLVMKWQRLERLVTEADSRAFLLHKAEQEPDVAAWTDATLQKTRGNLTRFLEDAGVVKEVKKGQYEILAQFQSATIKSVLLQVSPRLAQVLGALQ